MPTSFGARDLSRQDRSPRSQDLISACIGFPWGRATFLRNRIGVPPSPLPACQVMARGCSRGSGPHTPAPCHSVRPEARLIRWCACAGLLNRTRMASGCTVLKAPTRHRPGQGRWSGVATRAGREHEAGPLPRSGGPASPGGPLRAVAQESELPAQPPPPRRRGLGDGPPSRGQRPGVGLVQPHVLVAGEAQQPVLHVQAAIGWGQSAPVHRPGPCCRHRANGL